MASNAPDWLRAVVADGLSALIALGLDGQPAAEIMPLTADIWLRAIQRASVGLDIAEIDAPRIREGFDRLWPSLKRWPVPAQLIEQIPGRPERQKLAPPPLTEAQHAEGKRRAQAILDQLSAGFSLQGDRP